MNILVMNTNKFLLSRQRTRKLLLFYLIGQHFAIADFTNGNLLKRGGDIRTLIVSCLVYIKSGQLQTALNEKKSFNSATSIRVKIQVDLLRETHL